MAIPTTIESLSATAASNGPAGSEQRTIADDGLRQAYAFVKQLVSLANLASGSTITPPSTAKVFNITGTTTINTIASTNSWDGREVLFIFAGALTLTHSSNLALPGAANITTAANDAALLVQTASGAWRCAHYLRADGSLLSQTGADLTLTGVLSVEGTSGAASVLLGGATSAWVAGAKAVEWDFPTVGMDSNGAAFLSFNAYNSASGVWRYKSTDQACVLFLDTAGNLTVQTAVSGTAGGVISLSTRFSILQDGRMFGNALHNNAGAVTGTTDQYVASGTYTPTLTGVTNVAASTAFTCQWIRVGNVVTVSGRLDIDPTAATDTNIAISLPIASDFTATEQLGGTAASSSSPSNEAAMIRADLTNNRADMFFLANTAANLGWAFHFTYLVT